MPLHDQGYHAYSITELRDMLRTKYELESGETPDWTEDTFLGSFSEALLYVLRLQALGIQQLWDSRHIDGASGRALDARAAEHLLTRREATPSRAEVDLSGTPGTVVPSGKILECTANQTRWTVLTDTVLPATGVIVQCNQLGPTPAPIGTLTHIVTPVSGWSGATNPAPAQLGAERESDRLFRSRILRSGSFLAGRTAPALTSAVEALPFVQTAKVVNNPSPTPTTVGAFTVPAHGHLLLVEPAVITPEERLELGQVVFDTLGYGTQQGGSEEVLIPYRGANYSVRWDYATAVAIPVTVALLLAPGYVFGDVAAAAEQAIEVYFGTLSTHDPVLLLGVYGALSGVPGVVSATVIIDGSPADRVVAETEVATYDAAGSSYTQV